MIFTRSNKAAFTSFLTISLSAMCMSEDNFEYRHEKTKILKSPNSSLIIEVMDPDNPIEFLDRRFSPVALILQAKYKGKSFFYSTKAAGQNHDYNGGAPMEFDLGERGSPPGFDEAKSDENFLKIGVGILKKQKDEPYGFSKKYDFAEKAKTRVKWTDNSAEFTQTLDADANGYSYALKTVLKVEGNKIILDYELKNTGTKHFKTEQYLHNFTCFEKMPLSKDYSVEFPYEIKPVNSKNEPISDIPELFLIKERIVSFNPSTKKSGGKIWLLPPDKCNTPNQLIVSHTNGQKMIISASIPSNNIAIWVSSEQLSPEMNIMISLEPSEKITFSRTYEFFLSEDSDPKKSDSI